MSRFFKAFARGFTSKPDEESVPMCQVCGKPAVDELNLHRGTWNPDASQWRRDRSVRKVLHLSEKISMARALGKIHDDKTCPGRPFGSS